ncbi:MAG: efflux RND transporter periplasmic adaptor subunit [Campylobacteraceae bacterium]|nr:efflux RND transporter periplasmic adaptor subunit [Campylobacteraceae bacterium]
MKRFIKFTLILLILGAGGYFGYSKLNKKEEVSYLTVKPLKGTLTNSVVAAGEVWARDLVDVGAQVGGQIEKLYVKVGDKVKKGDMIAQIDSVKQINEIEKRKAQHEIYMADLNASEISANIAELKYQRELNLYNRKATSKESLENAKNDLALKRAKITQLKAQINQNNIDLDTAMTNLSYTKITAPLDGTIVSTIVKEGQTVNANQTTPLIVQIADLSKLEINMEVAEGDLPKIDVGMRVKFSILANPNKKFESTISSIDPAMTDLSDGKYARSSTSQTSSSKSAVYYYAKMLIDNKDNFFKIGMTTENEVVISESKDTIYIPDSAISKEDGKFFVKVLKGDKPVKKEVTLGITDGFYQEILTGINENDDIIMQSGSGAKPKSQMGTPGSGHGGMRM